MKSKLSQWLVLAAIIVFVALICLYGLQYDEKQIDETRNRTVSLNNTQKNYITENKDVYIYVDEELRYLMTGEDEGFLYEYLCEVFAPVSLEVHLTDKENADCSLMIITDEIRSANLETGYTSPVFQMDGAFFIHGAAPFIFFSARCRSGWECKYGCRIPHSHSFLPDKYRSWKPGRSRRILRHR